MRTRLLLALSVTAGLAVGSVAGSPASAASHASWYSRPFVYAGSVTAVDTALSTVSLVSGGWSTTVSVAASASVTVDRVAATLADVPVGARVTVLGRNSGGTRTANRVQATTTWSFSQYGIVAAVDPDAGTVDVERAGASEVVPVDAGATVTVDEVGATLADVPVGAKVRLGGTVTNGVKSATRVQATTNWTFRLDGLVDAVDTAAPSVSVLRHEEFESIAIDPAATVVVDGVAATLADVPAGARVRVSGTVTNSVKTATRLQVTTRWRFDTVGTVDNVDGAAATITVNRWGQPATFDVHAGARVYLNKRPVNLVDLPTGALVRVTGTVTNGHATATRIQATVPVRRWRH